MFFLLQIVKSNGKEERSTELGFQLNSRISVELENHWNVGRPRRRHRRLDSLKTNWFRLTASEKCIFCAMLKRITVNDLFKYLFSRMKNVCPLFIVIIIIGCGAQCTPHQPDRIDFVCARLCSMHGNDWEASDVERVPKECSSPANTNFHSPMKS